MPGIERASSLARLSSHADGADFICVDTETANSRRSSTCAVGVAIVRDGAVVATAAEIIDPECEFEYFNTVVNGLDAESVVGAPTFPDVWGELGQLLGGQHLVFHNSGFDVAVLRQSAARYKLTGIDAEFSCSMRMARRVLPECSSYGLAYLASAIGYSFDHHEAASDAQACAEVTLHLLEAMEVTSLADLHAKILFRPGRVGVDSFIPINVGYSGEWATKPRNREPDPDANPDSPLYGLAVCFTGTLLSMPRRDAAELVTGLGGAFKNTMSSKVDLLVLGDAEYLEFADGHRTGKLQKAIDMRDKGEGPEIIREADFFGMLAT